MPHLNLPQEQQQKLQSLIANLRAQDNMISLLAEFALAGYLMGSGKALRFVSVTPEGQVEFEEYAGPQLVEEPDGDETA